MNERKQLKLAEKIVKKHWRARWFFTATRLYVIHKDGLRLEFRI